MTKFNKSLLAVAVVGALALPGLVSAASLSYPAAGKQITFAKDLIVNNGTTIYTPDELQLVAAAADATRIATVNNTAPATRNVRVKVTLTNGAKFDTTADAATLVGGFTMGTQLAGAVTALSGAGILVGTPYYSTDGQELNFEFVAAANGNVLGNYAIELNSLQITNLVTGLFDGSSVGAEITAQNSAGQQILAAKAEIAKSKWGLAVSSDTTLGDVNKTIDVGADPRKTLFSPAGTVGGSAGVAGNDYFNAGALTVDIARALETGGAGAVAPGTYINNYSAVSLLPQYNVVGTADIVVKVTGTDLEVFDGGLVWLDSGANCAGAADLVGTVDGGVATFTSTANHALWVNVTNAPPSGSTVYVCFGADGEEINAQSLSGTVSVDYKLTTQRKNPPLATFDLLPLRLNGTTLYFQNVNPGDNPTAQSFLRLTNHNSQICPVVIDAKDDAGRLSDEVSLTLKPHASAQINTTGLDSGTYSAGLTTATGIAGSLGDGTGKWYVRVTAECANFVGSALNRNNDSGTVTNLTPQTDGHNTWSTPTAKVNP